MHKTCILLLLALTAACTSPPVNTERSVTTNTEQATPGGASPGEKVICKSVTAEGSDRLQVDCGPQEPPPPDPPPPLPPKGCEESLKYIKATVRLRKFCIRNCNLCVLTKEQEAEADKALNAECAEYCKDKPCDKKTDECVIDKVLNLTSSSACITGAKTCKNNPDGPDFCAELFRFGECTCKCVPKTPPQPSPTAPPQ
ncbi:MAG TPA: hypothetical protein VF297_05625 [Pyrinomonadaceae bacterium]